MEAAVEFCRLAGKRVVEVINKLMEDGKEDIYISGKDIARCFGRRGGGDGNSSKQPAIYH